MFSIGKYHTLEILRHTAIGIYLGNADESILLPTRYVPEKAIIGDKLKVFVYLDNENRPIATTLKPLATVGEFTFLPVKEVTEHGAFMDWGIAKDLFVPFAEQLSEMVIGKSYLVYISVDEKSGRIFGSSKWVNYIDGERAIYKEWEDVNLLIAEKTDLGFKAIINNRHEGLLYKNEVFENIQSGERKKGFIKAVREDGKIDLTLQLPGYGRIIELKDQLLDRMKNNNGLLGLGDKSSPEEIYRQLQISKKAFKKTLGGLLKEQLVEISDFETKLLPHPYSAGLS